MGTGKEQKITITANSGLSEQEIEKMVNEAKAHAEDDKQAKEQIETKNRADSMVYQTEKQLKEFGDKVPADVKAPIESGIATLKEKIAADDTEGMKTVMAELEQHLMKLGEQVYSQQQQQQGQPGAQASEPNQQQQQQKPKDDGVVDAEIVD